MERERFEKLLSDWLDEPSDPGLSELMTATAATPELAEARERAQRLDALLKAAPAALDRVNWRALRARIGSAANAENLPMDARIAELTDVVERVDWTLLRQRISGAVGAPGDAPRTLLFPLRRWAPLAAGVAAAIGLILVYWPGVSTAPSADVSMPQIAQSAARVWLGGAIAGDAKGAGVARVRISGGPSAPEVALAATPPAPATDVFVMMTVARPVAAVLPPMGLH